MSIDALLAQGTVPQNGPPTCRAACALVLMGGGARTAYQAGALKALAALLTPPQAPDAAPAAAAPFPFRWLFGTSAGALNASYLAARSALGLPALQQLAGFWTQLRSRDVYRLDTPRWARSGRLLAGWSLARHAKRHRALLDTMPLVDTLHRAIHLPGLEQALQQGSLEVLGVTASSYSSGAHWTFCQTRAGSPVQAWQRPGRRAAFQPITIEHLMASSAIPFLFPAVPLWIDGHKEHFGDGSMRQLAPLSPAIHFGAPRILAIGVAQTQRAGLGSARVDQPSTGAIAGHAMASVFHDTLQYDLEQVQRVSQALAGLPPSLAAALPYRPVEVLALQPSRSIDELAAQHVGELPAPVRHALEGLGLLDATRSAQGSTAALASYLLFEPGFVQALMALGEHDVNQRRDALRAFFGLDPGRPGEAAVP